MMPIHPIQRRPTHVRRRRLSVVVPVVVALAAGVLSGCGSSTPSSTPPTTTGSSSTTVPAPSLTWAPCAKGQGPTGAGFQCSSLKVPLNRADPGGATIRLALARHLATGHSQGDLLINPGGPGGSAVDFLGEAAQSNALDPTLLADFDVVAFDPPGVGHSTTVNCPANAIGAYTAFDPDPPGGVAAVLAATKTFGDACQKATGALLGHVSTVDAAHDMDLVRQALGQEKISYLGYSYGTFLGDTYAEDYPTHVRAMVLDGVVDPAEDAAAADAAQDVGFAQQFRAFAAYCQATAACPWRPTGDPLTALASLVDQVRADPIQIPADENIPDAPAGLVRTVGPAEVLSGTAALLYDTATWPVLGKDLNLLQQGNPSIIIPFGIYVSEGSVGAQTAVNCLDQPPPTASQVAAATKTAAAAGPFDAPDQFTSCAAWPVKATGVVGPIKAPDAPPILLVGSTGDPATPYSQAQAVSKELAHATLLTRDGGGHTAYPYSSCIRSHVDTYLTSLALPAAGTVCQTDSSSTGSSTGSSTSSTSSTTTGG